MVGGVRYDLSGGQSGNAYPSPGNVRPSDPAIPCLRISRKEIDSSVESQGCFFSFQCMLLITEKNWKQMSNNRELIIKEEIFNNKGL